MGRRFIFFLSVITFLIGCVMPYFVDFDLSWFEPAKDDVAENSLRSLSQEAIFKMILTNNLKVVATSILGGLSFGLLTFANTMFNGFMLGAVVKSFLKSYGVSYLLKAFGAHSIEFLGIIIACYLGYRVALVFYDYCFKDKFFQRSEIVHILKTTLTCVIIIFIAAYLEAYVTIN